ncbi:NRDE family protein [Klebsiella pneumoniae]
MPAWVLTGFEDYFKRIQPFVQTQVIELPMAKRGKNDSEADILKYCQIEGESILNALKPNETLIALEVGGRELSTEKLADTMKQWMLEGNDVAPTALLYQWEHTPIIAGQDLQSGGTWMGVTPQGRWAVLTNFRDGRDKKQYETSRGHLVQAFLESDLLPIRFAQQLEQQQQNFAGFNLFMGTADHLKSNYLKRHPKLSFELVRHASFTHEPASGVP